MGGSSPPPPPETPQRLCPAKVTVTMPNPGQVGEGEKLALILEQAAKPILVLATEKGVRLGPVAGIPELGKLLECVRDGIPYAASVSQVSGGTLTCVIVRQVG